MPAILSGTALSFGIARMARALTSREVARDYVLSARLVGARTPRVLLQEVLPNIAPFDAAFG